MGSVVKVVIEGDKVEYEIVGSTEVDPIAGKISSDSPIGSALLGKKAGEKVVANTPSGPIELKIVSIA
jgi:transcription elongation factor GreA